MNYRECLEWMERQGYNAVLIPLTAYDGCVAASHYEPIFREIAQFDRASAEFKAEQFFIEVAGNMRGEPCAFVYPYPIVRVRGMLGTLPEVGWGGVDDDPGGGGAN